jgi:hypothetical protein
VCSLLPVSMQGLFGVAKRFYLLFQHHTTPAFEAGTREFVSSDLGWVLQTTCTALVCRNAPMHAIISPMHGLRRSQSLHAVYCTAPNLGKGLLVQLCSLSE